MVSGLGRLLLQAPQFNSLKVSISLKALLLLIARQPACKLYCVDLDNLDNDGLSLDDPDGCTATSPKDLQFKPFAALPTSSDANDGYRLGLQSIRQMPLRTAVL